MIVAVEAFAIHQPESESPPQRTLTVYFGSKVWRPPDHFAPCQHFFLIFHFNFEAKIGFFGEPQKLGILKIDLDVLQPK